MVGQKEKRTGQTTQTPVNQPLILTFEKQRERPNPSFSPRNPTKAPTSPEIASMYRNP